eukprot:scaffold667600_cov37-Prasinocladus_malaysianus.AAC.1
MDEDLPDSPTHEAQLTKEGSGKSASGKAPKGANKARRRDDDTDADGEAPGGQQKKRKRKGSKAVGETDAIAREREDL